jgi:hypothetical protein
MAKERGNISRLELINWMIWFFVRKTRAKARLAEAKGHPFFFARPLTIYASSK